MRRGAFVSAWRPTALPSAFVAETRRRAVARGIWLQLATLAFGVLYVLVTDKPLDRGWFVGTLVAAGVVALTPLLPWDRLVHRRVSALIMLIRSFLLAVLVSCAIGATGGVESEAWVIYALL